MDEFCYLFIIIKPFIFFFPDLIYIIFMLCSFMEVYFIDFLVFVYIWLIKNILLSIFYARRNYVNHRYFL